MSYINRVRFTCSYCGLATLQDGGIYEDESCNNSGLGVVTHQHPRIDGTWKPPAVNEAK
jgi:hypothetical protein